jgi:hypothetical protein
MFNLQCVAWLSVLSAKSWSHDQASYEIEVAPLLLKVYRIARRRNLACS